MAAVASLQQQLDDVTHPDVGALYERYAGALRRFFGRRSLPPEDVADLTQEVFVRLLQYVRQRDISRPQAFIFVTASNL
jgi:DNA-directed RNA polymerase specialized sigma24 family protein